MLVWQCEPAKSSQNRVNSEETRLPVQIEVDVGTPVLEATVSGSQSAGTDRSIAVNAGCI